MPLDSNILVFLSAQPQTVKDALYAKPSFCLALLKTFDPVTSSILFELTSKAVSLKSIKSRSFYEQTPKSVIEALRMLKSLSLIEKSEGNFLSLNPRFRRAFSESICFVESETFFVYENLRLKNGLSVFRERASISSDSCDVSGYCPIVRKQIVSKTLQRSIAHHLNYPSKQNEEPNSMGTEGDINGPKMNVPKTNDPKMHQKGSDPGYSQMSHQDNGHNKNVPDINVQNVNDPKMHQKGSGPGYSQMSHQDNGHNKNVQNVGQSRDGTAHPIVSQYHNSYNIEDDSHSNRNYEDILQIIVDKKDSQPSNVLKDLLINTNIIDSSLEITNQGFDFLLKTKKDQLWILLIAGMRFLRSYSGVNEHDFLLVLFEMSLFGLKSWLGVKKSGGQCDRILRFLEVLGFIEKKRSNGPIDKMGNSEGYRNQHLDEAPGHSKVPQTNVTHTNIMYSKAIHSNVTHTNTMHSNLSQYLNSGQSHSNSKPIPSIPGQYSAQDYSGVTLGVSQTSSTKPSWIVRPTDMFNNLFTTTTNSQETNIFVETNFRIYAYQTTKYDIHILKLFSTIITELPNLTASQLTEESINQGLNRGISADQICYYLKKRSNELPKNVEKQIYIWESKRNRIVHLECILFKQFLNKNDYMRTRDFAKRSGVLVRGFEELRMLFVKKEGVDAIREYLRNHVL